MRAFATVTMIVLPAVAFAATAEAQVAPPQERSTAQVESTVEPTVPASGVALEIGADEKPVLKDGKATPAAYQLFTFRPPAGRLFEVRLFAPGAPEGSVSMEIYRGDSKTPVPGAGPANRTLMWMSSSSGAETLRILVLGRRPGETPFQIGAKLFPKEKDE